MAKMKYTGSYVDDSGKEWDTKRDSSNREWLIDNATGETKLHPDSVKIQNKIKQDPRALIRGQQGYKNGGSVRGVGCAQKGHGKGKVC
jgi:hypothetical protein